MDTKPKQYVSDVITEEEYSKWTRKIVFLPAGTGKGKTIFMLIRYIPYLKSIGITKVLYLCNRTKLKEQIIEAAEEAHVEVDVRTYQYIEQVLNNKKADDYDIDEDTSLDYDAFIMDEAHYFLSDSTFNLYIDISFNWIMSQDNKTRVFMSATGIDTFRTICKKLETRFDDFKEKYIVVKNDNLMTDYSYVSKVYWFYDIEQCTSIVENICKLRGEKALLFVDSTDKLEKYSQIPGMEDKCDYFYGQQVQRSAFGHRHKKLKDIYEFYTDKKKFLMTTTALDNGVDVKNEKIKHIICDVFEWDTLIQCLGRKRIESEGDTCTFYIRVPSFNDFNNKIKEYKKNLDDIDFFLFNPDEWKEKEARNRTKKSSNVYQDYVNGKGEYRINELREAKFKVMTNKVNNMLRQNPYDAYKHEIERILRLDESVYSDYRVCPDNYSKANAVKEFLEKHVDKPLTEKQEQRLTMLCDIETDSQKGIGSIVVTNRRIKELGITGYELRSVTEREATTRKTKYGDVVRNRKIYRI